MTTEEARKILSDNYDGKENSLIYALHEDEYFSVPKFWEYYGSIAVLAGLDAGEKSLALTMQITETYQQLLKEIIYHFAPDDGAVIDNFPENYNDYIDRIGIAVFAYFSNDVSMLEEEKFSLRAGE